MPRKTFIAAAVAAMLGAVASFGSAAPAQATPLSHALQSKTQVDHSMVTPVHSKKKRYHKRRHHRYGGRRSGISFSFGFAPGFYYSGGYHPRVRIHTRAPRHCHTWRDRFGHRHRTCHRHY